MKTGSPTFEQVEADFGQDFLFTYVHNVSQANADTQTLRREHADWAATFSLRFYANFMHERIWALTLPALESHEHIQVVDKEPRREFTLDSKYRARFKKHDEADSIRSYPTPGAETFWQPGAPLPLDELAAYPLAFGYRWDAVLNQVLNPVVSLRKSKERAIWIERLELEQADGTTRITHHPELPDLPGLEVAIIEAQEEKEAQ